MLFLLSWSAGTSPSCHDVSNLVHCGLATFFTTFLRIHEFISSGALCTLRFLRWSQTKFLPTSASSFSLSLPLPLENRRKVWLEHLPVKTGKKVMDYFSLLHVLSNQVSHFFPEMGNIFPSFHFITIKAFLVALDVPDQI